MLMRLPSAAFHSSSHVPKTSDHLLSFVCLFVGKRFTFLTSSKELLTQFNQILYKAFLWKGASKLKKNKGSNPIQNGDNHEIKNEIIMKP